MNGRMWTPEQIALLRQIYPSELTREVAQRLGRSTSGVWVKAQQLGIKKTPAFLAGAKSGRIQRNQQHPAIVATRFRAGQEPWNKGTSFRPGGRCEETQFKPGQRPHTWLPVGTYRIVTDRKKQRNLEQKISDQAGPNHVRWKPVARIVWEAAHGPTPKGWLVVFKPGIKTLALEEITLDRLECISRADNARRNHPGNQHPEIARLYQLKGAITRQVNRRIKEADQQTKEATA